MNTHGGIHDYARDWTDSEGVGLLAILQERLGRERGRRLGEVPLKRKRGVKIEGGRGQTSARVGLVGGREGSSGPRRQGYWGEWVREECFTMGTFLREIGI